MLKNIWIVAPATMAMLSGSASGQTLAEDFTKATITNNWAVKGTPGACLTAGTPTNNSLSGAVPAAGKPDPTSTIPGCNLGTAADAVGSGALRLTPALTGQNGAIVWKDTFPTKKGLQVTFTTHTYGGSTATSPNRGFQGADGISFFLMDGAVAPNIGAWGGSLGYSCSNSNGNGDGLEGAYLGLGMDEFGNFLNSGDNTASGINVASLPTSPNGYNSYGSGLYFQGNRIGLRGAGNISWAALSKAYPLYYTADADDAMRVDMVKRTCASGFLHKVVKTTVYTYDKRGNVTGSSIVTKVAPTTDTVMDYPAIKDGYWVLPDNNLISNVTAKVRTKATPITYRLMITPAGNLNFMYSYNGGKYKSVLSNHPITKDNGILPATFRFGFAAATGGSTNVHEISCFVAEPTESTSSAGANTVQAGQVRTGTQVYLAAFNPNNWTGSLVSADLKVNADGSVVISSDYNWDLNCKLTGGLCSSMGSTNGVPDHDIGIQAPANRTLITYNGTSGVPLDLSKLSPAQQAILKSTDGLDQARLNWLRGDRGKEQTATPTAGPLRARGGVLGDIVDSSPTWVGPPSLAYGTGIKDALYGAGSESSYTDFAKTMAQRTHVVYAGSNDGFLHGARAGSNDDKGAYVGTNNDGAELLAYMPASVLADAKVVELTSPTYGHNYYVDAAPGTGDVYYGNAWHTWIVGGLGPGGKEIYALDVTNPTAGAGVGSVGFSEANAANIVKGSWNDTTLDNLGNTYGTPLLRRMHNGQWAVIFGNGIGNAKYLGGIYIGLIDKSSGAVTFQWISTGKGDVTTPNGITNVASGDLDGDRVVDYLYAGDLLGNVWRIDVTSKDTADWAVSTYGRTAPTPLFAAMDGSTAQPITTKIAVAAVLTGGTRRVVLGLGTGRVTPFTDTTAPTYAKGVQTIYGLWDWDMDAWNSGTTTAVGKVVIPASNSDFASLTKPTAAPFRSFTGSDLYSNILASSSSTTRRELAIAKVCWFGSSSCATGNTQYGWRFDLPDTEEQLIYNPVFTDGVLVLNTTIPPVSTPGQCTPVLPSGWTMAFRMDAGGGAKDNLFTDENGSLTVATGHKSIVGIKKKAVGTPYIVTVGSKRYTVNQTIDGEPTVDPFNPQGGLSVKRVSVEQLR